MISVNNQIVDVQHFPDRTQLLKAPQPKMAETPTGSKLQVVFTWKYENDEELVTIMFLSKHYRDNYPYAQQLLTMWYVPNARMDRVKKSDEVFTLKYFCQIINDLGFDMVTVLDPHSNVTPALLNHVDVESPKYVINRVVRGLDFHEKDYVYFPDEGAAKRYSDLFPVKRNILIGHKRRDWETGKIVGLEISGQEGETFEYGHFGGCSVLMIDDIISYGGTLAYSADELKNLGFKHIYAYATHIENSILDEEKGTLLKRLNDGTVEKIYTTNSTYKGQHDKIVVLNN